MMKRLIVAVAVMLAGGLFLGAAVPNQVAAESKSVGAAGCKNVNLFGMPAWYDGMLEFENGKCEFTPIKNGDDIDMVKTGAKIAANVLRAALVLVAYVALFFIIQGGFMYMTSAGSPDGMARAKNAIMNALIGMVIAILAASIVNAIGAAIK